MWICPFSPIGNVVGFRTFSDRRLKTDIRPSELGLDFINQLNPVTYEGIKSEALRVGNEELKDESMAIRSELAEIKLMLAQYGQDLQFCCLKETNAKTPQTIVLTGESPVLEQNIPNPFAQSTTIQYYVPKSVKTAVMQITDANGKVLQTAEITERGANSIVIQMGDLSWGTYFYALILDGKVFETKKMIVANRE